MTLKKKVRNRTARLIDEALGAIIDQWYLTVGEYYVTCEKKAEDPEIETPEELKRFHDEAGHRIKFNKGDIDFTYGLSLATGEDGYALEVSVNNKSPNLNYGELFRRLAAYYEAERNKPIEGFKNLKKICNCEIFALQDDLNKNMSVEQRQGRADIIRMTFEIRDQYLDELIADPPRFMDVIQQYCVAPLRRIYADVYRAKRK